MRERFRMHPGRRRSMLFPAVLVPRATSEVPRGRVGPSGAAHAALRRLEQFGCLTCSWIPAPYSEIYNESAIWRSPVVVSRAERHLS
ncbi:hypothetical protein BD413DRAFT_310282 [Trametes elegans]|nr:hypothetical protein BD413DRAFT_310282 [Trametes elegans]